MKKLVVMLIMVLCFVTVFSGCGAKEEVIIYTNIEENRSQLLQERVNEQFPDLDVKIQYLSTGNTAAKIKTEGTNVEADIVLGLETSYMESLKDNFVVLNGLDGINDDHYLDGINPEHGQYYIWDQYSASITIDKKFFDDKGWAYPTSYEDLLDPKYAGLIAMPDPKSSGTGYMYYLNVMNLMGEEEGLAYFDKLSANIAQFTTSGSGPISLLVQGEVAIAMGMTYQGVEEINKGADFKVIEFDTGLLYNTTSIGIIKGKEADENVRKVFQWVNTEFSLYDKENFIPGKIFKEQTTRIENYPETVKLSDMTGIDDNAVKERLLAIWKY
ncbi:MAG: extracellular solute-binding protein [Firmicutes bacterium]|nr:extracellular solute-binding protein [Bacillota bacterium]